MYFISVYDSYHNVLFGTLHTTFKHAGNLMWFISCSLWQEILPSYQLAACKHDFAAIPFLIKDNLSGNQCNLGRIQTPLRTRCVFVCYGLITLDFWE